MNRNLLATKLKSLKMNTTKSVTWTKMAVSALEKRRWVHETK